MGISSATRIRRSLWSRLARQVNRDKLSSRISFSAFRNLKPVPSLLSGIVHHHLGQPDSGTSILALEALQAPSRPLRNVPKRPTPRPEHQPGLHSTLHADACHRVRVELVHGELLALGVGSVCFFESPYLSEDPFQISILTMLKVTLTPRAKTARLPFTVAVD